MSAPGIMAACATPRSDLVLYANGWSDVECDPESPFYAVTPRASLRDQAVFRCASLVALCNFQLPPLRRAANL